jgi:hypothetical protein
LDDGDQKNFLESVIQSFFSASNILSPFSALSYNALVMKTFHYQPYKGEFMVKKAKKAPKKTKKTKKMSKKTSCGCSCN